MKENHGDDIAGLRKIVGDEVVIIYDASHTIGLMIGGKFQAPLREGADIITANTHKTLHGPHKGVMAFRQASVGKRFVESISNLLSSTHFSALAALSITLLELDEFGEQLAKATIENANELASQFSEMGYRFRNTTLACGTHNHQAHIFIDTKEDYRKIYGRFYLSNIAVNFDNALGGQLYLRMGSQNVTRRGMGLSEMKVVARLVDRVVAGEVVRDEAMELTAQFPSVEYSFDNILGEPA